MQFDFKDRQVLVSGGTSGIGAAIAAGFAEAGASVVAAGLPGATAPPGIETVELDVRDGAAVAALAGRYERLDVLVNAAGIIRRGAEHEPETFEEVVDINLNGTMRLCAACRSALAASGAGAVVNLASMLSFFGGGLVPAYSASKGGIAQLTKSLAIAWAGERIRVNAIAPGWIETPLTKALVEDPARSGPILARTPLGRWGVPADLVGPVLFLCSPAAAFVTGTILPVDGGYLIG
ncbi:SDR family oxidoreductase [Labrys sp. LIt4]|uniref:2-deoxy-D-gluconate 3-dehydrogenase n=1 Tax=Labrys okinawensis TaxID=346911 RepID=A0A2S9QF68_9HYPH|nr:MULTISPECIES: SDR family oxidoreductase [Labrys]MBP0578242.1 SDR family oxidoreductase [Labrys sp. LIt4]PRH87991.1 2-deoxy-D-gluconate 3-dehydrogenase [Labrys okinawensis]